MVVVVGGVVVPVSFGVGRDVDVTVSICVTGDLCTCTCIIRGERYYIYVDIVYLLLLVFQLEVLLFLWFLCLFVFWCGLLFLLSDFSEDLFYFYEYDVGQQLSALPCMFKLLISIRIYSSLVSYFL